MRHDLGSLFESDGSADLERNGLTAALGRLRTRPYATRVRGICRRDEVVVNYGGRSSYGGDVADNMIEPFGVTARAWFKVVRKDIQIFRNGYDGRPHTDECTAAGAGELTGWFTAPTEWTAAEGHLALAAAIAQLQDPRRRIGGCRETREARRDCLNLLPAAALNEVESIDQCVAEVRAGSCFIVAMTNGNVATIDQQRDRHGAIVIERVDVREPGITI